MLFFVLIFLFLFFWDTHSLTILFTVIHLSSLKLIFIWKQKIFWIKVHFHIYLIYLILNVVCSESMFSHTVYWFLSGWGFVYWLLIGNLKFFVFLGITVIEKLWNSLNFFIIVWRVIVVNFKAIFIYYFFFEKFKSKNSILFLIFYKHYLNISLVNHTNNLSVG